MTLAKFNIWDTYQIGDILYDSYNLCHHLIEDVILLMTGHLYHILVLETGNRYTIHNTDLCFSQKDRFTKVA